MGIRWLPATFIALEKWGIGRFFRSTFHAELALIDGAALGAGPSRFRPFPFGPGLATVHTEFPRIARLAAVTVPCICRLRFRFLSAAVQSELALVSRAALRAGPAVCRTGRRRSACLRSHYPFRFRLHSGHFCFQLLLVHQ